VPSVRLILSPQPVPSYPVVGAGPAVAVTVGTVVSIRPAGTKSPWPVQRC
jgi:hypothetical protein